MKIIRKEIFETNSSSTHSLVVPKKVENESYSIYDSLDHDYAFGRGESRLVQHWDEKLAYVYMVLQTNYAWGNDEDRNWRPKHFTTSEEMDGFRKRVWKIWEEVVNYIIDNKTKYDSDKDKHVPLNKKEKEEEKRKYLDLDYEYRDVNPEDLFWYLDAGCNDGDITGDDHFHVLMKRETPFVDHANGFDDTDFIDRIKTDDEFLKRLLFSESAYITIGGDEYRGYNIKTIGFEYDYKEGDYRMNEKGELPPKEWLTDDGRIKDEYWDKYWDEYTLETGEFWDKLREYEKDNDVYLKGN